MAPHVLEPSSSMNRATLTFQDQSALGGTIEGYSFGADVDITGEVVFNTGMVGYPEALTDPSYRGQILCLTYPLIGNYGVPDTTLMDTELTPALPLYFESGKIQISGLIVSNYVEEQFSHWCANQSLGSWLKEQGIPAICGVDTRQITKCIREHGSLLGRLNCAHDAATQTTVDESYMDPNKTHLVAQVSTKEVTVYTPTAGVPICKILAFDCGIKYNIIRYLVKTHNVQLIVLPYDYPLADTLKSGMDWEGSGFSGLFLSNGPGDPTMCASTIENIKYVMENYPDLPIFGICLGNQLLALAAGANTFKLTYGNRGMNQPCIDLRTGRCYITPQNHGYAVDPATLPNNVHQLFLNANDGTNEGIIWADKPWWFSCQFHPEAMGGPEDTNFLFKQFVNGCCGRVTSMALLSPNAYTQKVYKKVLLIGSGGLSIGQAGEFDYSGSQCIKALKEEGIEVVLINPNIATVQTSPSKVTGADRVYFLPILADTVKSVILREKPDGVIVSMGGQTALNVGIELWNCGFLQKHKVEVLGTQIDVIEATEDREIFSQKLKEINETIALSYSANTIDEAKLAANKIGYPVLIRAAFALGGLGSGFAHDEEELVLLASKAFTTSNQILIDQDLRGWKELEYEVVRDCHNNCITVCNMENFDPLGIHTGDSIVVAPSQTLSNREYFMLRATALKVVRHLGIVGECNIQYALDPKSERYCIIEVNARLSRSSALASKATGYPLAYVATKLSLGKDLVTIRNSVTKNTTACFEPSLDYCVLKMPRWDLKKFSRVSTKLGSSMLSVGEVMAIGRSFEEVMQKACRMVNPSLIGLEGIDSGLIESDIYLSSEKLENALRTPTDTRLFAVMCALEQNYSIDRVHECTKIDKWFLSKLQNIAAMRHATMQIADCSQLNKEQMLTLKRHGFSDAQLARYIYNDPNVSLTIRKLRKELDIVPVTKQIDTLAAEFPAQTNYLYCTYNGNENDVTPSSASHSYVRRPRSDTITNQSTPTIIDTQPFGSQNSVTTSELKERGVIVLGCGAYCIGSSVEFDWCAVSCVRQLRKDGIKAIVINYNPETVSTDYDESDRLYFEELSLERVLDIYESECAGGIIVSVGGQIPNNLAHPLHMAGANILGTHPDDINRAEDRNTFSAMLDQLNVNQPQWSVLSSKESALQFADDVGYPVLVRPSFVLSGAAMRVAESSAELSAFLELAADVAADKPVVVTKFIMDAKEIEFDAIAQNGKILNYAIGEHLENAGVHSGDATVILPAQKLYTATIRHIKKYSAAIAQSLNITGPFNIQFMAKGNHVQVIECNLRASRTFPFVSKTLNSNFISLATRAMSRQKCTPFNISLLDVDYVCVKAPMFSFTRLRGADPMLGVEMASTGEVACFGESEQEAFLNSMLSAGFRLPSRTKRILLSIASDKFRMEFHESVKTLVKLGYTLYGTPGTAEYYGKEHDSIPITTVRKPVNSSSFAEDENIQDATDLLKEGQFDLLINISDCTTRRDEISSGYLMRRAAVDFGTSLITNVKCAEKLVECMEIGLDKPGAMEPSKHIGDFYKVPIIGNWQR
jgi:carbamoyl-phosphate synthase/aspartate carbamoyltransferase